MYMHVYGPEGAPVMVMLAPMMVSGEDLYGIMAPHLQGTYRILSPDQGGHGKAGAYVSPDLEYASLKEFLQEQGISKIHFLYGASLGVAVAYRLFGDGDFSVERAWFDGVALGRNAFFMEQMMRRLFRSRKRSLKKMPGEASPNLVKVYGEELGKRMTENFSRITVKDIDAICAACCHYDLRAFSPEEQRRLHLDFGEKDFDLRYSRKTIPVYFPEAELTVRKGFGHCEYMAKHTAEYVAELEAFAGGGKRE